MIPISAAPGTVMFINLDMSGGGSGDLIPDDMFLSTLWILSGIILTILTWYILLCGIEKKLLGFKETFVKGLMLEDNDVFGTILISSLVLLMLIPGIMLGPFMGIITILLLLIAIFA